MSRPHAVVTGAASGLGRTIAEDLAAQGWDVTGVDIQADRLTQAAAEIARATGRAIRALVVDLGDVGAAAGAIAEAWATAPIDGLVNAAAIYPAIPYLELDAKAWTHVQTVNVTSPFFATQALARLALAAGRTPAVVNVASGAARRARPGASHYSTSKAALVMATQASAIELGAHGIRVNAISPGFFAVDSAANPVTAEYEALLSETVLPGPADAGSLAATVRFLLSDAARWITGAVIPVDGGSGAGTNRLPLHWTGTTAWQRASAAEEERS
ncbi:SDR family NAD(P)-dependent oxidoreductase [Microbacterium betulae]|uniref:SDR family NAD(P)-dependent oxidoreductase n=1 Tax=Microbacterium betulae TaxID=2981139 RepID=A0AA97FHY5_9MICO|nr:SDR family oxidoreductase [Microbacterium sp. AB]WOF22909.1 SDR family NAD(P)-dependent oxidoreductase [Microbacterium sp. AB]